MPAELERSESESTVFTGTKRIQAGSAGQLSKKVQVKPCTICGTVVSRASDVKRHMRIHNSDSTKKLLCHWEGCEYRTLQKSNLDTHYRRHTKNKIFICTDDPNCKFQTCDPASLLRHRKRLHDYTTSRCKTRSLNSSHISPATLPSSSSIPSPCFLPFRESEATPSSESSLSLSHMDSSLPSHCQESLLFPGSPPPWDSLGFSSLAAEPQSTLDGSHGWFGPANPSHLATIPGYYHQDNFSAEFQSWQDSLLTETFTTFTGTNATHAPMPGPSPTSSPPTYSPLDLAFPGFPL